MNKGIHFKIAEFQNIFKILTLRSNIEKDCLMTSS